MHMRKNDNAASLAMPKLLVTVDEAAQALSLGRTQVYSLVMRRQLFSVKVGARRLIPTAALHEYVQKLQGPSVLEKAG
jgi:excisionase family DNA binding protein